MLLEHENLNLPPYSCASILRATSPTQNNNLNFLNKVKNLLINKKNIKKIGLPYVTKGNWNKIYQKLILDNPSINFVYLYRKYDMEAWKFAKKGFFNFKKHIPELISKL